MSKESRRLRSENAKKNLGVNIVENAIFQQKRKEREQLEKEEAERAKKVLIDGRAALNEDQEYRKSDLAVEVFSDLLNTSATVILEKAIALGLNCKPLIDHLRALKDLTDAYSDEQFAHFKVSTEEEFDEFTERQNFIYDSVMMMVSIPKEKRLQLTSTLKILSK